ncbi:MAG: hypothetical protein RSE00_05510 [Clostridia bacterium]
MNYLDKLKEKCDVDDRFFDIAKQVFDKLFEFGYINRRQISKLEKKLYNNVDTILLGTDISLDYKTGYYDAVKKELYIKDLKNIESVYLRIIYIITTNEISKDSYTVGYSSTCLSKSDYKIKHKNFGINRAIISNLVCRLLYTIPTTLSIVPTYRTYENDFLGNKITSDNDIYFLEGRLLSQICYIFNTDEEGLYSNLFLSPKKYLLKFFHKNKFEKYDELLDLLDYISRRYSNCNKLLYLNRLLNKNYLNIKKNILNDNVDDLKVEQNKIKLAIQNALSSLISKNDVENDDEFNEETSLSEEINKLEEEIMEKISKVQNILVDVLISSELKFSNISYAIRLKELNNMLILKSDIIDDAIYKTISHKLLNTFENTASNLIEKMKYSIVNEILSSDKYIKIYKTMVFNKLQNLNLPEHTALMALSVDNIFMQLVLVNSLNMPTKSLKRNTKSIHLDNLGYLLNNPTTNSDIHTIEKIFTNIHNKYSEFNQIRIENMFITSIDTLTLVIVMHDDTFSIIEIKEVNDKITSEKIGMSEPYTIFNLHDTNMPTIYNKKESVIQRVLSFFAFFA